MIERALDVGCVPVSFLVEHKHVDGEAKELIERCGEIPVYTAEFDVLTQLTGFKLTRGMLCAMHRPKLPTVQEVCAGAKRIAVLEDVVNPTNVGAIFRSAAALNIDAVLLTPQSSNPLYRRAIRVSMGTVFQVPWTFLSEKTVAGETETAENIMGNLKSEAVNQTMRMSAEVEEQGKEMLETKKDYLNKKAVWNWQKDGIKLLHELGFKTAALALREDSVSIDDSALMAEEKLAIILGTEGDGLASSTIADCDYTVMIPMSHGVDSLNVAAASAVAFWQLGNK